MEAALGYDMTFYTTTVEQEAGRNFEKTTITVSTMLDPTGENMHTAFHVENVVAPAPELEDSNGKVRGIYCVDEETLRDLRYVIDDHLAEYEV